MHTSYHFLDTMLFSSLDELQGAVRELEKLTSLPVPDDIQQDAARLNVNITQRRIEIFSWIGTWEYRVCYYTQSVEENVRQLGFQQYSRQQVQRLD